MKIIRTEQELMELIINEHTDAERDNEIASKEQIITDGIKWFCDMKSKTKKFFGKKRLL